jgi:membrane-bound lytic murein transglycosylase D
LEPPSSEADSKQDSIFEVPTGTEVPNVEQFDVQSTADSGASVDKKAAKETIAESTEVVEEEAELFADPTDYTVSNQKTIEIQAAETLGHYAEWLGLRASRLRRINKMKYRTPVVIGQRLKMDFSKVTPEEFVRQRTAYHKSLQESYFERFQITGSDKHKLRRGQSLWSLAKHKYKIPLWLIRQYNPDLAFNNIRAGITITIPHVSKRDTDG